MEKVPQALLIGVAIGAVLGFFIARQSARKNTIHGGFPAQAFHLLSAISISSTFPTVITGLIIGTGFLPVVVMALSLFVGGFVLLLGYAVFEKPARDQLPQDEDRGWTAEDALTSGL